MTWRSGLEADSYPSFEHVFARHADAAWTPVADAGLEVRDLRAGEASHGRMTARHVRATGSRVIGEWECADVDFRFLYILDGTLELESASGARKTLEAGASAYIPGPYRARSTYSPDCGLVEVRAPAEHGAGTWSVADTDCVFTFDRPESYTVGTGLRQFFEYRDLGAREPSGDRLIIDAIRATAPGAGTGWHWHTMSQWFFVLGGEGYIRVEEGDAVRLQRYDSMCLGPGERMRHVVGPFGTGWFVLSITTPASFETTRVEPPPGSAPDPPPLP